MLPVTIANKNNTSLTNDSHEYLSLAENITSGVHYAGDLKEPLDFRLFSKRPLGYAVFLNTSGLRSISFIQTATVLLLVLLYAIGLFIIKEWKGDLTKLMIVYTINFVLLTGLFISTAFIMADLLLSVLVSLMVYLFILHQKNERGSLLLAISVIWSMALLVKPILLPSLLLIPLVYWFNKGKRMRSVLLLPFIVCAFVFYQNYRLTSVWHFSSISSINKVHYNSKLLISNQFGHDSAQTFPVGEELQIPQDRTAFKEYISFANQSTKTVLTEHFQAYLKLHLIGMFKSVLDPGRFELYTLIGEPTSGESLTEYLYAGEFSTVKDKMKQAGSAFQLFLVLLVLSTVRALLFILGSWRKGGINLLLVLIVLYFIGIAGPIGAFRFLLPAIVPYLLLSSLGFYRLLLFFQKGSKG